MPALVLNNQAQLSPLLAKSGVFQLLGYKGVPIFMTIYRCSVPKASTICLSLSYDYLRAAPKTKRVIVSAIIILLIEVARAEYGFEMNNSDIIITFILERHNN